MGMCIGLPPKSPKSPYIVEIKFRKPSEIDMQKNADRSTKGEENDSRSSLNGRERNELTVNSEKLFQSTSCKNLLNEGEENVNGDNNNNKKPAIDPEPSCSTNEPFYSSKSVWGKSNNLVQASAAVEESYKRLISNCESKDMEAAICILENQFHKLLLITFERRKSLQRRLYQQKLQQKLAQQNFASQLLTLKLLFDSQRLQERWKGEWNILENELFALNKEFENFGKVKEEANMFKFIDILIQYFEKNRLISRSISTTKEASHASVQCQDSDFTDLDNSVFKFNRIEERSSQCSNRSYCILNRRNTRLHQMFWSWLPHSPTSSKCNTFLWILTLIVVAIVCYLLTISGDTLLNYLCNQRCNSSGAIYGITWSEMLKPIFVQKQNPPRTF